MKNEPKKIKCPDCNGTGTKAGGKCSAPDIPYMRVGGGLLIAFSSPTRACTGPSSGFYMRTCPCVEELPYQRASSSS